MTGTITWSEDRKTGKGMLVLKMEDGTTEAIEHDEPIIAASDSHDIASMFGEWDSIDHDGDYIHVTRVD